MPCLRQGLHGLHGDTDLSGAAPTSRAGKAPQDTQADADTPPGSPTAGPGRRGCLPCLRTLRLSVAPHVTKGAPSARSTARRAR